MRYEHPADPILNEVLVAIGKRYKSVQADIEKRLKQYTDKRGWKTTGLAWAYLVNELAGLLYEANTDAVDEANAKRFEAFSEGANLTGWKLAGGGTTRGGGAGRGQRKYDPLPFTPKVAEALQDAGLLDLAKKVVKKKKDIAWSKRQIRAVVNAALINRDAEGGGGGTRGGGAGRTNKVRKAEPKEEPNARDVARKIVAHAETSMRVTAQQIVFSSYDGGIYIAGVEASGDGFDIEKTWLGIPDMRIRDSHRHLNGTTLPIMELFRGFNGVLRYPHDPMAPPAETMNCRCRLSVHMAGDAPKGVTDRVLPSETAAYRKWRDNAIRSAGTRLTAEHRRRLHGDVHR